MIRKRKTQEILNRLTCSISLEIPNWSMRMTHEVTEVKARGPSWKSMCMIENCNGSSEAETRSKGEILQVPSNQSDRISVEVDQKEVQSSSGNDEKDLSALYAMPWKCKSSYKEA